MGTTVALSKQEFLNERPAKYAGLSPTYAWRVYRAESQGYSRSQARGHASTKRGELPITVEKVVRQTRAVKNYIYKRAQLAETIYEFGYEGLDSIFSTIRNKSLYGKARGMYVVIDFYNNKLAAMDQKRTKVYSTKNPKALATDTKRVIDDYDIRKAPKDSVTVSFHLVTPR